MSPQVLPIIAESGINLDKEIPYNYYSSETFNGKEHYDWLKEQFLEEEGAKSWLSYNLANRKAYQYFKSKQKD